MAEVLIEGACELVERGGHLEVLLEDAALALDAHDLGTLDEPVEVLLGRQVATDAELLRPLLEQRVHHLVRSEISISLDSCYHVSPGGPMVIMIIMHYIYSSSLFLEIHNLFCDAFHP